MLANPLSGFVVFVLVPILLSIIIGLLNAMHNEAIRTRKALETILNQPPAND